ncbi:MAG TPA: EF-hand domain-containing protein [Polyangia bacterium]|jgi:hypothetical protein
MRSAVLLASLFLCASASARTKTYAVIIAENRSLDPGVKPLQFADDDGAKTWELFSLFADRIALFVVLDADTARLHPDAARHAESPERAAIFDKLARYNAEMAADLDRGDEPELFFIYAGHGDVDGNGQGYVNLRDAKLTRAELYRDIIAPSKAKFVHVVVDACKSYFLVNARGAHKRWVDDSVPADEGAAGDAHLQAFLEEEQLERHPRAGVIVATSGDQETHEWARYRGGILSHELRSALSGAADVNGDGKIEYSELRAFLAAANARVRNPEARVDVFARAPALDRHRAIVDLSRASPANARFLRFGAGLGGRFFVEDDRGVRVLDLNKEPGAAFDVMVSARHAYYVRSDDQEAEARPGDRRLDVASLSWHARAIAARGALDTSFRNDLYREPFGRAFYDGFVATSGDLPVEDAAAPTLVATPLPRARPRHRISIAYGLSGAPAGDTGLSNGVDIRYTYRFWRALDLGIAGEMGHGAGASGQSLWRTAAMIELGAEWRPIARLGLRIDSAIGWQLLSGNLQIGGQRLTGTEPRGLRFELAGGVNVNLAGPLGLFARGGLALDGVYPDSAPSSLRPNGFLNVGLQFSL